MLSASLILLPVSGRSSRTFTLPRSAGRYVVGHSDWGGRISLLLLASSNSRIFGAPSPVSSASPWMSSTTGTVTVLLCLFCWTSISAIFLRSAFTSSLAAWASRLVLSSSSFIVCSCLRISLSGSLLSALVLRTSADAAPVTAACFRILTKLPCRFLLVLATLMTSAIASLVRLATSAVGAISSRSTVSSKLSSPLPTLEKTCPIDISLMARSLSSSAFSLSFWLCSSWAFERPT